MNELNETWEDKLHRTQEVQKERERALEELGITVEKNLVGVHTPKKVNWIYFILPKSVVDHGCRCPILSIWYVVPSGAVLLTGDGMTIRTRVRVHGFSYK